MTERTSPDPDPAPSAETSPLSEPGDTLLSAGKPAERWEVELDDRLATVDRRLTAVDDELKSLDARMSAFERRLGSVEHRAQPGPSISQPRAWLWVAFLIVLLVVFQALRLAR